MWVYRTHLKIDNFSFKLVENVNYLGSILNEDNKMNTEIAERITEVNKAYYANAKLIKSKSLTKNTICSQFYNLELKSLKIKQT